MCASLRKIRPLIEKKGSPTPGWGTVLVNQGLLKRTVHYLFPPEIYTAWGRICLNKEGVSGRLKEFSVQASLCTKLSCSIHKRSRFFVWGGESAVQRQKIPPSQKKLSKNVKNWSFELWTAGAIEFFLLDGNFPTSVPHFNLFLYILYALIFNKPGTRDDGFFYISNNNKQRVCIFCS